MSSESIPIIFLCLFAAEDRLCRVQQYWEFGLYGIPDDFQIDTEVFMGEQVAEVLDISLWHLREVSLDCFREFSNCFADDLEFTYNGCAAHPVGNELFEGNVLNIGLDCAP